ncbi:MAG: hypothetical protein J6K55_08035 [Clostridia bacterium]|nr:hypothetical protein [Clostridia bacterium]
MAKYTIEDIEILRQKSGISYEEAVNLLEYHNGSLARALVDLEKNGRIKSNTASASSHKGIKGVFDFLFRLRLKVKKEETTIVNLSALFMLIALGTAPHICVIGLIASIVLGYRITLDRDSREFADDTFDDMVKNAKSNVQQVVSGVTKQFTQTEKTAETENASAQPRTESAPSGTRPVNVQFHDGGSVNVRDDGDGYHEADIR